MKKTLSIVVPAYNVENYLEKTLDSMIAEEILDDIEVLIINDGSLDRTEEIAGNYSKRYPKSFFVYTKDNGGHGSAINYGIRFATGKYFKVVDGDDWLNTEELVKFIGTLRKRSEDIIASDYVCIENKTGRVLTKKCATRLQEQYNNRVMLDTGTVQDVIKMHALTIRTEILKKNHIVIDEHCYYVDCEYIAYPIPFVESVYFDPHSVYVYRLGRKGQSVDIKSMQKNEEQHQRVLNQLLKFYATFQDLSVEKRKYLEKVIAQVVENQFQIYISMGWKKGVRKELKAWDQELKSNYPGIYAATKKKSIQWLRKTDYWILGVGSLVYSIVKR